MGTYVLYYVVIHNNQVQRKMNRKVQDDEISQKSQKASWHPGLIADMLADDNTAVPVNYK